MALFVATTLPTVLPLPTWQSGITATPFTKGIDAVLRNCSMACSSTGTPLIHALMGTPLDSMNL
jgi:hypothetical protein